MITKDWKTYRDVPCGRILREKVKRLSPIPLDEINGEIDNKDYTCGVSFENLKAYIESRDFDNPVIAAYGNFGYDSYIEGLCVIHDGWETDDEFSNRRIAYQKKEFKKLKNAEKRVQEKQIKLDKEFQEYQRLKAKFEDD